MITHETFSFYSMRSLLSNYGPTLISNPPTAAAAAGTASVATGREERRAKRQQRSPSHTNTAIATSTTHSRVSKEAVTAWLFGGYSPEMS
jgi:hypothetical protein